MGGGMGAVLSLSSGRMTPVSSQLSLVVGDSCLRSASTCLYCSTVLAAWLGGEAREVGQL